MNSFSSLGLSFVLFMGVLVYSFVNIYGRYCYMYKV